ncbi:MAG: hypothetical protein WBD95_12080 [Xanthobacteraceae bacterium]
MVQEIGPFAGCCGSQSNMATIFRPVRTTMLSGQGYQDRMLARAVGLAGWVGAACYGVA